MKTVLESSGGLLSEKFMLPKIMFCFHGNSDHLGFFQKMTFTG